MWPVIGHDAIVSSLQRGLKNGNTAHAYLFSGLPHVGKMTLAVTLAQALNCGADDKPCGECSDCCRIAAGNHPDVQIIKPWSADEAPDKKAKSEIVIDQVRGLQHWASLPPFEGRCRVFIFEKAELLNIEAANCLLKTLEEPLPRVVFLLLASNPELLPETVVSRCRSISLKPIPSGTIEKMLRARGVEEDKAVLLARLARGAPGSALLAEEDQALLTESRNKMKQLAEATGQGYEERFELAEELAGRGSQNRAGVKEVLDSWMDVWRDLILIKVGAPAAITNIDLSAVLTRLAIGLRLEDIRVFIRRLVLAQRQLSLNVNPRLLLEVLMLEMPRTAKVGIDSKPQA